MLDAGCWMQDAMHSTVYRTHLICKCGCKTREKGKGNRAKKRSSNTHYTTTFKLTKPMYWTKSDQADGMVLHVVVPPPVPLPGQLGPPPQAADHEERQDGKAEDARDDRDDDRFG